MKPTIETRVLRKLSAKVRQLDVESGAAVIEGVAVEYDKRSENLGGFVEVIAPGAFGDLEGQDVIATAHHDVRQILGRTPDTLELDDDEKRLAYEIAIPDTQAGRDTRLSLERGDIRGSSFSFFINGGIGVGFDVEEIEDDLVLHTVRDATLIEVAPVVHPAYSQTVSEVVERSVKEWKKTHQAELEELARRSKGDELAEYERRLELMRI